MQSLIVTVMSCYLVIMAAFCSHRGGGGQKGQKNAVILNAWPLVVIAIERDRWVTQIYISTATDCEFIQDFLTTWEVTVYSC